MKDFHEKNLYYLCRAEKNYFWILEDERFSERPKHRDWHRVYYTRKFTLPTSAEARRTLKHLGLKNPELENSKTKCEA
jgi:hypothetical protein